MSKKPKAGGRAVLKRRLPACAIFEDTGEVEHVMHLVRKYASYGRENLPPEAMAIVQERDRSVLIYLENKLGDAHVASEFRERDPNERDYLSLLHSILQEALRAAQNSVHSGREPGDWTDKKLDELNRQLLRIHEIDGDIARDATAATKLERSKGGIGAAKKKQETAAEWQRKIEPEIKRLLKGGMTATHIGARLAAGAGQSAETVRKYAARFRRAGAKK